MEFNSRILFNNIAFLLKNTEFKVGELETAAGVSTGYISRTSKDESSNPSIEFVAKTANFFGVGLDLLINVDLGAETETEIYLAKLIDKLVVDTNSNKLDWKVEKAYYLNNLEADINGFTDHDLFYYETFQEQTEAGYAEESTDVRFKSDSYGMNTYIADDCFYLQMKDYRLYVMKISKSIHNIKDPEADAIELWMVPNRGSNKFLVKDLNNSVHNILIKNLYRSISEYNKKPKIDNEVKRVLDAYLFNSDLESEYEEDDWDSGRIPF